MTSRATEKRRWRRTTAEQIAKVAERLLTATSMREIARELDLDKRTVNVLARPIITAMRDAGTLGLCTCGRERFHPRICSVNVTGSHKRWQTPDQIEKRKAILDAIMAGKTYAEIGRRWGISQRVAFSYAARHLTDEQRALRKSLEQRRERRSAMSEAYRPFRDEVYAKIDAAVPRWLSDATRDDIISEMYLAASDGTLRVEDIEANARRFANAAIGMWEGKFGPRSIDVPIFDDGSVTLADMIPDPAALAAFATLDDMQAGRATWRKAA